MLDPVTGLPALDRCTTALEDALLRARLGEAWPCLIEIAVDGYASIADERGTGIAERLLTAIARRFGRTLSDDAEIFRGEGPTFVVVFRGETTRPLAERCITLLLSALAPPFDEVAPRLHVSATAGIALAPDDGATAADLFGKVRDALQLAMQRGPGTALFPDGVAELDAVRLRALRAQAPGALARGELRLVVQPFITRDGLVAGVEALLRWANPTYGVLEPAEFLDLLESAGETIAVGQWVMQEAARLAAAQRAAGAPLEVSFNVSPSQFNDRAFVERLRDALASTGAHPADLVVELTERSAINRLDAARRTIDEIRTLGCHVALDDFGTGFSSLSLLRFLPVDAIKIDRSFVHATAEDARGHAFVEAILALARSVGSIVYAEGVETAKQLAFLRSVGCDRLQGYGIMRPVAPADVPALAGTTLAAR